MNAWFAGRSLAARQWRAMGGAAEMWVEAATAEHSDRLADAALAMVAELEQRWSRFVATSDLCRINTAGGRPVEVAESTVVLIEAMASAHAATAGAFDPTLLAPLAGLGYGPAIGAGAHPRPTNASIAEVRIDRQRRMVAAPAGMLLDAGGIGKGLAADLVSERLVADGAIAAMVSLGGDLRIVGDLPDGCEVCVEPPDQRFADDGASSATLVVAAGGVATSGSTRHSWIQHGTAVHHLLDPRRGAPTPTDGAAVVQATVVAGTAMWAEAMATALMVGGELDLAAADELGLGAAVWRADGRVEHNRRWAALRAAPVTTG